MKIIKIQTPGPKQYSLNGTPVKITATNLSHSEYRSDYPLDTSVEIDGLIYLVRFSELTAHESPGELREFKVPRVSNTAGKCRKAPTRTECGHIGCSECIYDYLWRNSDEK